MNASQPINTAYYCATYVSLICCLFVVVLTLPRIIKFVVTGQGSSHSNEILPVAISAPGAEEGPT